MKKDNQIYLQDILKAIAKVDKYVKDITFESFQNNSMRQDAVIRQLEIIGEATNKLTDEFRLNHPEFPIKEAIRMRNFLIHSYDEVDLKVVWKTIQNDIPLLKEKIPQPPLA